MAHRDDDVDNSFKATVVIKLTEDASSFRVIGAQKDAVYPEGAGWGVMFPASAWHEVLETSAAVKLTIHLRGEYIFPQREVRRESLGGRVQLGGSMPDEAEHRPSTMKDLAPFHSTEEAVERLKNKNLEYHALYGLKPGCGQSVVMKVYRAGALYLHADKLGDADAALKEAATGAWLYWDIAYKRLVEIEENIAQRKSARRGGEETAYVDKAPPPPGASTSGKHEFVISASMLLLDV